MPSNYKTAPTPRNAGLDAVGARLNSGRIEVRAGTIPATVTTASGGTLLGTLNFGATAFSGASGGSMSAQAITSDTNADNSGTAEFFRMYANGAADTACESQGTAGNSGDTPDLEFDNKVIVAGGTIAISSLSLSQPEQ